MSQTLTRIDKRTPSPSFRLVTYGLSQRKELLTSISRSKETSSGDLATVLMNARIPSTPQRASSNQPHSTDINYQTRKVDIGFDKFTKAKAIRNLYSVTKESDGRLKTGFKDLNPLSTSRKRLDWGQGTQTSFASFSPTKDANKQSLNTLTSTGTLYRSCHESRLNTSRSTKYKVEGFPANLESRHFCLNELRDGIKDHDRNKITFIAQNKELINAKDLSKLGQFIENISSLLKRQERRMNRPKEDNEGLDRRVLSDREMAGKQLRPLAPSHQIISISDSANRVSNQLNYPNPSRELEETDNNEEESSLKVFNEDKEVPPIEGLRSGFLEKLNEEYVKTKCTRLVETFIGLEPEPKRRIDNLVLPKAEQRRIKVFGSELGNEGSTKRLGAKLLDRELEKQKKRQKAAFQRFKELEVKFLPTVLGKVAIWTTVKAEEARSKVSMEVIRQKIVVLLRKIKFLEINLSQFHKMQLFPKEPFQHRFTTKLLHAIKIEDCGQLRRLINEHPELVYHFDSVGIL